MKYCIFCGTQLGDDDEFCYQCGKKQNPDTAEEITGSAGQDTDAAARFDKGTDGVTAINEPSAVSEATAYEPTPYGAPTAYDYSEGNTGYAANGAGVAPDAAPKKPFFKRPIGIVAIVAAALVVIGGVAFACIMSTPQMMLMNAFKNTAKDIQKIEAVEFLDSVGKKGSVSATVDMEELLKEEGLDVEGELVCKEYFDYDRGSTAIEADFRIHDATAIDAGLWVTPEAIVVNSDVLLGKDAYGVGIEALPQNIRKNDYSDLLPDHFLEAIEEADSRLYEDPNACKKILEDYFTEIVTYFGKQVIEKADFEKSADKLSFADSTVKADVITVKVDEKDLQRAFRSAIEYAAEDKKFVDARELLASTLQLYRESSGYSADGEEMLEEYFEELQDAADDIDELELEARFYIYKSRLVKAELEESQFDAELSFTIGPNPADPELIEVALTSDYLNYSAGIEVKTNTSSEYDAELYFEGLGNRSGIDFSWDKRSGDYSVKMKGIFSVNGTMLKSGDTLAVEVDRIKVFNEKKDIGISMVLKAKDSMPPMPQYKDVLTMDSDEIEDVVDDIRENIYELAEDW